MTTLVEALETLSLLPDWENRYTYLIELARALPTMPAEEKNKGNLVPGCTSQVWMTLQWQQAPTLNPDTPTSRHPDTLLLHLESDALIVRGLMALIYLAYNGKTRSEIAAINLPELMAPTQLLGHLSPNRRNGFASVVKNLQALAA